MSGYFLFIHVNEWAPFRSADTIPISAGYILSVLQHAGYSGGILSDVKDRPLEAAAVKEKLEKENVVCVGFSAYEENIDRIRFWARFIKKLSPQTRTIIGGPQATFMPVDGLQQMAEIDYLCRCDGEMVMPHLAEALLHKRELSTVPGICFKRNDLIIETEAVCLPDELDMLPSPYLDGTLDPAGRDRVILFTSRGCNGRCRFCYTPRASGHCQRFHSIERVVEEVQYLQAGGMNSFWFADPNFAATKKRVVQLCSALKKYTPGISFWCQARYHHVDDELACLIKDAGGDTIAFGLESSSIETQKKIGKNLHPAKLSKAIEICQKHGLEVELFSLFGLPGDTFTSSVSTLEYVKKNHVPIEGNSISQQLHLFFGTDVNDDPEEFGLNIVPVTRPAYHSPGRNFYTADMSQEEIEKMSLIWRLNRTDFDEKVHNGGDLFSVAGFINQHFEKLADTPRRDLLLAQIYKELDEIEPMADCLERLQQKWLHDDEVQLLLAKPLISYTTKRRSVISNGCRVIFDCKGLLHGQVIPETECYYQSAVIGEKKLLSDFEQQLTGLKSGSAVQFDVVFPADYGHKELAGKIIPFQVYIHQVLQPVIHDNLDDLRENNHRNMYRFDQLVNVKKYNEALYYMVLRDSVLHSMTGNMNDMLALFDYYLKLGFYEKALDLAHSLRQEESLYSHIGKMLQVNGLGEDALDFLNRVRGESAEVENQRIRAYMQLGKLDSAEDVAANPLLEHNMETLNLKVKLAEQAVAPLPLYLKRMEAMLEVQTCLAVARAEPG